MFDLSLTLLKFNFKTSHSILNQKLQKKSMEYSNPLDYRHRPSRSFQYLVTTATDFDRSDDREVVTKEYTLQSSDNRCRDAAIINLFYVVVTDQFGRNRVRKSALFKHQKTSAALCEKPQLCSLCLFAIDTPSKNHPSFVVLTEFFFFKTSDGI